MKIAIITARGGSKRIPDKNIREFAGRPMLEWPIMTARKTNIFDRIIVSTDSEKIAEAARKAGAEVPFIRPASLADDHTPTAPVLLHAMDALAEQGISISRICCIYPTTPFLLPIDLERGLQEMIKWQAPAAISVTTFDFPIMRALKVAENGEISFNWPECSMTRSQDLPQFFHDAGQFYWLDAECFRKSKRLIMRGARPVVLPRARVLDIDTPEDWDIAELMAKVLIEN